MVNTNVLIKLPFFLTKAILFIFLLVLSNSCNNLNEKAYTKLNKVKVHSNFAGSISCKNCHKKEYAGWQNSHHQQSMKIADSTTILGNFDNVTFKNKGINYSFFKKDGNFYVNTEGENGKYQDFKITYTFGVTPLQQYLIEFPDGKYQCLLAAWDAKEQKWYDLQPDLKAHHDEWMHWTGGSMRWNTMCADCHSTNLEKNFDSKSEVYTTSYSEINVSCEACHGPSSLHVNFYKNPIKGKSPPQLYMHNSMSSKEVVDKCARCHSRRSQLTKKFNYKGGFLDHYNPSLLIDPIYELDGQIKDEDYVYGSFIQSKMYLNGVSCKDCHNVHSLKLKKEGNALCLQCHAPKYDTYSHHFHKKKSQGAQCVNCHMPGKIYMGNDFRRDHSFRVPRPDQTVKYKVPNACNTCHKDKSAVWASNFIKSKYGYKRADHFSDHLLKGYFEDNSEFEEVFSNKQYPEIVRATALNQYMIQQSPKSQIEKILMYLNDSSALVKNEVIVSLEKIGKGAFSKKITGLLNDSIRSVRISAVRYFNLIGQDMSYNINLKKANIEYLESLDINADFASGQHQMGIYYEAKGNLDLAIKAYKKALEIDNYYNASRINLALLYYKQGNISDSEQMYLKVIEQEPDFSSSYYMLGLLYNETGDTKKALEFLHKACEKETVSSSVFYNYALLLQKEKHFKESILAINKGLVLFPNSEKLLYVKLLGQLNLKLTKEASVTCLKLIKLAPNNINYKQILKNIDSNYR